LATIGLSEMKVKSLRRHVNGRGTIRAQKMSISVTRRRKTWKKSRSKHVGHIVSSGVQREDTRALLHRKMPLRRVLVAPAVCWVSARDEMTYEAVVECHICNVALFSQGADIVCDGGAVCNGVARRVGER
jgi:hypothetical protein